MRMGCNMRYRRREAEEMQPASVGDNSPKPMRRERV